MKAAPSSVTSTVNSCSVASFWMAAIPAGIEPCRKPAVLLKTKAVNECSGWAEAGAARTSPVGNAIRVTRNRISRIRTARVNRVATSFLTVDLP